MAQYKAILIGLAAAAVTACTAPSPPPTPTATVTVTVEPSPTPTPTPHIDDALTAVGRIVTERCEGGGSGSGFLVTPDLVLTADHVVAEGARATITFPDDESPIGLAPVRLEPSLDIALLRLERPVSARPFEIADHPAKRLQPVTVIGYPLGMTGVHTNLGTVSSTEDDARYSNGVTIEDVLTLDAAVNPGNSGGPVIDSQLAVLGLISGSALNDGDPTEGLHFAIPASHLRTLVDRWGDEESGRFDGCGEDDANVDEPELLMRTDHTLGTTFGELLAAHGRAINESDYSTAWDQFTVAMKGRQGSLEEWSAGLASTRWIVVEIREVVQTGGGSAEVRTFVRTHQDTSSGPNGQVCSIWPLTYDLKVENGEWHIDRVKQRARQPAKCTR